MIRKERVLCLDVGEKRIGVAVSDDLGLTAQGLETIQSRGWQPDIARVSELAAAWHTRRILCGLPLNMDGSMGFQAEKTRAFAERLTAAGFDVRFQDERMTTRQARSLLIDGGVRRNSRKEVIDKVAATYILQAFLDAGGWIEKKKSLIGGIYIMDENKRDLPLPEEEDEQENLVELVDEDGQSVRFEHLMSLEHEGKVYICLMPAEPMEDVDEDELVIMRIETDAEGNDFYTTIENEEELNAVFEKYLEIAEADE